MRRWILAAAVLVAAAVVGPAASASAVEVWSKPVPGRVVRPFEPPATRYGRGHLGVDFAAPPGSAVRAVGAGRVVFAGLVGRTRHVVVEHPGAKRSSYSFLATIGVRRGQVVGRGAVLGTSGGSGPEHAAGVVHLGLRIGATYVDPMQLFAPVDLSLRVHLAPTASGTDPSARGAVRSEVEGLMAGGLEPAPPIVSTSPATAGATVPICYHRARSAVPTAARAVHGPG